MLTLERFSIGVGDRFAHQAKAQLRAFQMLAKGGVEAVPVWNKSNREHTFIGSEPQSVFDAAQAAVKSLGWSKGWYVDADHIRLETVDRFIPCSDFFTIDVADSIGKPAAPKDVRAFLRKHCGRESTLHDHAGGRGKRGGQVSPRRAGRREDLPPHRRQEGRGQPHRRGFHG
jgi:hypothetical protein